MRDRQTVAIAGAGIAGITAAFFAAQKGYRVVLVEPAPRAGGLLASDVTPYGAFDYGTHVATYTGVDGLDDFLFGGVREQDFNFFNPGVAGNYYAGTLSEISPFVDARALPLELLRQAEQELQNVATLDTAANLEELMCARFGPTVYHQILAGVVVKFMGCDAAQLTPDSINLFDMNRVLAFDAATSETMKAQARYNDSLGFHGAYAGAQKLYPRAGGMGYWIEFLMRKLADLGVTLVANSSIGALTQRGDRVSSIDVEGNEIKVDQLIWSISPALFARLSPTEIAFPIPQFRKTALYDFAFEKPLNSACYYINDYDTSRLSGRITLYSNLTSVYSSHNCTVEVLAADDFDFEGAGPTVLAELHSSGLVDADNPCLYQGARPVSNGFPVPELNYTQATTHCSAVLEQALSNVIFIGRAPGRFFMRDVLAHTSQRVGLAL